MEKITIGLSIGMIVGLIGIGFWMGLYSNRLTQAEFKIDDGFAKVNQKLDQFQEKVETLGINVAILVAETKKKAE